MDRLVLPVRQVHQSINRDTYLWVRWLLVILLVFTSLGLSLVSTNQHFYMLLGVVPGLVTILIFLRWPAFGLIVLIVASLIIPFSIGTGTETRINPTVLLLALLVGLWLLDMIARRRQLKIVSSRTTLPLLVLVILSTVSFISGQLPWFIFARQTAPLSAQIGGFAILLISIIAFLLTGNQIKEIRWLEWLTWIFIILCATYFSGWLLPNIGSITSRVFQQGAIQGGMLWTWFIAMAFGQAIFNQHLGKGWRLMLGMVIVGTLYIAYFLNGGWKSGYLPPLISIAAILSLRSWKIGGLIALAGLWIGPKVIFDALESDQYSYSTRIDAAIIMIELLKSSPLVGFGPANYYFLTTSVPLRGYWAKFNSHNQYLDILIQFGGLGLLAFLWFVFEVGRLAFQLRNRVSAGFEKAYVYGVLGGLAGTLGAGTLADWIIPSVYNVGFDGLRASVIAWIFMGGLVSLEEITRQRELATHRNVQITT